MDIFRDMQIGPGSSALLLLSGIYADGGIQRFNRTLLAAADQLGVRCDVLSLSDHESARTRWEAPRSATVATFGHNRLMFTGAAARQIIAGKHDFILIGHINLLQMAAAITRIRKRGRVFLIAHGIEVWSGLTGGRRRAFRRVDLALCVSRYTQSSIQRQVPEFPKNRLSVFPNALSNSWRLKFAAAPAVGSLRLPERFILSVTRLDRGERYKGITSVLEALAMLEDQKLSYLIAGRGDDLEFYRATAKRLKVESRVFFLGAVSDSDLANLYTQCSAFVLPSAKEGFGIVFLEAMFFGACVIAASEKGALDVVQHEKTGLLVPYGDVVSLKQAIERVFAESPLADRMRTAGRATVTGNGAFTFQSFVARLAEVLSLPAPAAETATALDAGVSKEVGSSR